MRARSLSPAVSFHAALFSLIKNMYLSKANRKGKKKGIYKVERNCLRGFESKDVPPHSKNIPRGRLTLFEIGALCRQILNVGFSVWAIDPSFLLWIANH